MPRDISKQPSDPDESQVYEPQEETRQPGWSRRQREQARQASQPTQGGPAQNLGPGPGTPTPVESYTKNGGRLAPQNDIADVLLMLANLLPDGPIKDFLLDIAEWFENLSQNETFRAQAESQGLHVQGLVDGECMKKVADEIRSVISGALVNAATELPRVLQTFIGCFMGGGGTVSQSVVIPELTPDEEAQLSPQQKRQRKRELRHQAEMTPQSQEAPAPQIDLNMSCLFKAAMVYWKTRDISQTLMALLTCQLGDGEGGGGFLGKAVVRCTAQ